MNTLYLRLAFGNLQKHHRLYVPYLLTGAGLVAMFYILCTVAADPALGKVIGGSYLPVIMELGCIVVALMSAILLLYTNSFLMKRRKQEFGLYNILGMEKRHIARVLGWESLFCAAGGLAGGLVTGAALYKLFSMLLIRLLGETVPFGFYCSWEIILATTALFAALYLICYGYDRLQIRLAKPIELLRAAQTGEKEPRTRWLLVAVGVVSLGAGYFIAITTESPLRAILLFFGAVLLVILGTYCLFTAGSIALLKLLKGWKRYYYTARHMTAVSGLLYRMKQNAVGLASICILSTMVLVMISSTVCLYTGVEETIHINCPYDLEIRFALYDIETRQEIDEAGMWHQQLRDSITAAAVQKGVAVKKSIALRFLNVAFMAGPNDELISDKNFYSSEDALYNVLFITAADYTAATGEPLTLAANEMAFRQPETNSFFFQDRLVLFGKEYALTPLPGEYPVSGGEYTMYNCLFLVVADDAVFQDIFDAQCAAYGRTASRIDRMCGFQFDLADRDTLNDFIQGTANPAYYATYGVLRDRYSGADDIQYYSRRVDRAEMAEFYYSISGGLFFLGLVLGSVFLMATVLVIYYKQISEGYEDRARFQIMQRVGMSRAEVRRSIRSQILLVFFLPLGMAAVHIAFAFPILTKLLRVLSSASDRLYFQCTLVCIGVFALVYTAVYAITARLYYKIVE